MYNFVTVTHYRVATCCGAFRCSDDWEY